VDDLSEVCLAKGHGSSGESKRRSLWIIRTPETPMCSLRGPYLLDFRVLRHSFSTAPDFEITSAERSVRLPLPLVCCCIPNVIVLGVAARATRSFVGSRRCAKNRGSNTELLLELPCEMALIRKTSCGGNLYKWIIGIAQTLRSPLEA
jgi:hypothetical protein